MKNLLFLTFLFTAIFTASGQKMAHDRYTISGGLLGALNYDKFRVEAEDNRDLSYIYKIGWSAGGWVNLPLGRCVSLEPQVMYSVYDYESVTGTALLSSGTLNFVSVPLLFKFHLGDKFALTLGPQADFLGGVDGYPAHEKSDFTDPSFSVSGGFEVLPHAPITFFGRYIHGLSDMNNTGNTAIDAEYFNTNFQTGIKIRLFGKMIPADTDGDGIPDVDDACPVVSGLERYKGCPIPDTDMDGINDEEDKCPTQAGTAKYMGCPIPDTDGDGFNDEVDKCPKQAGIAKYNGCPIPDTDGDGFNDEVDKCPKQAGIAKYNGCPIPDTDGDGLNDENDRCPNQAGTAKNNGCPDKDNDGIIDLEDRCPDLPGPADNGGCPKVESAKFTTQRIQFVTGSSTLTADSKLLIAEGAKLLNSEPFKLLKVEVRGHTDNVGNPASNLKLSQKRADAVKAELIKNGVAESRLTAIGFGDTKPIGDNATKEGRAQNRRVAFDVSQ